MNAATLKELILGISTDEVRLSRRGFFDGNGAGPRLERVGESFLQGYHLALRFNQTAELILALDAAEPEWRGFVYEGAAMSLSLQDRLIWRRDRWDSLLSAAGERHAYMLHVGAGWTIARLPWLRRSILTVIETYDPLLRWLVIDGFGFHEGYFSYKRYSAGQIPGHLPGYGRNAFDQGFGRSLWFVHGASADRVASAIQSLPAERQPDLWSGVGLACAYAGAASEQELTRLRDSSGQFAPNLAQGVAFAAKARHRAGNLASHTEMACRLICGMPAIEAAAVTDEALHNLPADGDVPAYEIWRRRIQTRLGQPQARESWNRTAHC